MRHHGYLQHLIWLIVFIILASPSPAAAQGITGWTEPLRLSASLESKAAFDPKIAADGNDHLHVVWRGWAGPDYPGPEASNAIFYSWWDGDNWSDPTDVLASENLADDCVAGSIRTTPDGYVVVAWYSPITVSWAPIGMANDARAWTSVKIDAGKYAKLTIDPQIARWYLTYVSSTWNVMLTYSDDAGRNWIPPRIIWANPDPASTAAAYPDIALASDGSIQIAWSEHTKDTSWGGAAIWHARIPRMQEESAQTREVARRIGLPDIIANPTIDTPALVASPDGLVFLFWNNGVGSTTGRFYQWSQDNGLTWSQTASAFPGLSGQTQQTALIMDSAGRVNMVTAADKAGSGYSGPVLWYATWQAGAWAEPSIVWAPTYAERPALTVSGGNRLHLVWLWPIYNEIDKSREADFVTYSARYVNAPSVPPAGLTQTAPAMPELLQSEATRPPSAVALTSTQTPINQAVPAPAAHPGADFSSAPIGKYGAFTPLAGILPAGILVFAVVAGRLISRRRRSFRR